MKYIVVLMISLIFTWGWLFIENHLEDSIPLEEIEVPIKKKPEPKPEWWICLQRYPDIKEHGKAHKCYRELLNVKLREEMYRTDI